MDIVRICGGDYMQYEALLLRRDSLKKDALHWQDEYIRVFGELIMEVYKKQVECIKLKKSIAFCQAERNRGNTPDKEKLDDYISGIMSGYYEQLRSMADENKACKEAKSVPEYDVLRIKKIYRDIAKKLHPDISPLTGQYPELMELWYRMVSAYNCNSLKETEEVAALINSFLEQNGEDHFEMTIPNVTERITGLEAEIQNIVTTAPYNYRELLCDQKLVEEKKQSLNEELETYSDYADKLQTILDEFLT